MKFETDVTDRKGHCNGGGGGGGGLRLGDISHVLQKTPFDIVTNNSFCFAVATAHIDK